MNQFLQKRRNATNSSGLYQASTHTRPTDKACEPSAHLVNTPALHLTLIIHMTAEE